MHGSFFRSTVWPNSHSSAIEVCRKLWHSFVDDRLHRDGGDPSNDVKLRECAADIARDVLSRDLINVDQNQIRIHPTTQRLLNYVTAIRGDHPNVQRPQVHFIEVSIPKIEQTADAQEDQQALQSGDRPASWLYQYQWENGYRVPTIVVDSKYVEEFLDRSPTHHSTEKDAYIICLVLKELMHYLMHWDKLQPNSDKDTDDKWATLDKENNQFRPAKWASLDEEEEAWIGYHLFAGLAAASVARDTRNHGHFDGAWKYR